MWQAKLLSVETNLDKTVDTVAMTVDLFNDDGRTTTKKYLLYLDEMETISLTTIKEKVVADLARLEKLDTVRTALESKIGKVF